MCSFARSTRALVLGAVGVALGRPGAPFAARERRASAPSSSAATSVGVAAQHLGDAAERGRSGRACPRRRTCSPEGQARRPGAAPSARASRRGRSRGSRRPAQSTRSASSNDDARAAADEGVAPEPPALDRLEQEAASPWPRSRRYAPSGVIRSVAISVVTITLCLGHRLGVRAGAFPSRGRPRLRASWFHGRRHPRAVRTPFGKLGGALAGYAGDRARRDRDPRCARPRGRRRRGGRVRDHGPGAAGRRRPGARAAGGDRRGPSDRARRRHDQQGVRVLASARSRSPTR